MNGLVRTAHRAVQNCVRNSNLSSTLMNRTQGPVKRDFTRGIWHMSCSKRFDGGDASSGLLHNHSNTCSCGCGIKGLHTKEDKNRESAVHAKAAVGERELVEFLTEEIVAERKAQKVKMLPQEVDGFKVEADDAEVVLSKQMKDELVRITFNVNHTVDSEEFDDDAAQTNKQEFSEMRSKPQFEVDLVRGDLTLGFTCSYLQEPPAAASADEYNDIFGIDEVTIYKGEWNDKVYAVAGDVLDGYLYDLLMNILEEKGVSNEFAQKLSDFSTAYEHSAYINLLENISKFTVGGKK